MEKGCLIIAYHFYPNGGVGAKRYNLLSYYLSKKLKVLSVLTIKAKYSLEKDKSLIYGGEIYRTGFFPRHLYIGNKIIKIINKILLKAVPIDRYAVWIIPTVLKGIKIIKKDQIKTIIVTGPPFSPFITGYLLSILLKTGLILDYQDPWVIDIDRIESKFTKRYNWFLEKLILKRANKIIFNTPETLDGYKKLDIGFNIDEKSFVIPNPYFHKENVTPLYLEKDFHSYPGLQKYLVGNTRVISVLYLEKDKKVIIYAGNFYGKRRLKYLFEPLQQLFCNGELKKKISIHVFGKIHDEDAELIKKLNLNDVIFEHERIEYTLLTRYLKGADILYLSQGDDHCYSVPYKLIDYMTIEKPILIVTSYDSSTYNFMHNVDCGLVADIDKPDSICEALKKLLIDEKKFSYDGIEKYSLENVAEDYYKIISQA